MAARELLDTPPAGDMGPPVEHPPRAIARPAHWERVALGLMVMCHAMVYGALSLGKLRHYLYNDFDLSIFAQASSRLFEGSTYVSIRGMSWLGDHASYVLVLLAPIYRLFPSPSTLLIVQSAVLACGAIPTYRLARRTLSASPRAAVAAPIGALALAGAYLLHPALGYLNLFEFHPEVIATTALLFALDALEDHRSAACMGWAVLALLCREDVALVVAMLGVWCLLFRKPRAPRLGAALAVVSLVMLGVTLSIVRPLAQPERAPHELIYQAFGATPFEILANALTHPFTVIQSLLGTPGDPRDTLLKREFVAQLLLPLAGLSLLAPARLLVCIPVLCEHLLSARTQQHTIVFQYTALLLPILMWSAIHGMAAVNRRCFGMTACAAAVIVCAGASQFMYGPLIGHHVMQTSRSVQRVLAGPEDRALTAIRDRMVARVPPGGAVVAGFEFLPRLVGRRDVHSVHHVIQGTYTHSRLAYPVPTDVSAVIVDWSQRRLAPYLATAGASDRITALMRRNGLVPLEAVGDIVLYGRSGTAVPLVVTAPDAASAPARASVEGGYEVVSSGVDARVEEGAETVRLTTTWRRVGTATADLVMDLGVVDEGNHVVAVCQHALGYGASPSRDWIEGVPMRESYALVLDRGLPTGRYRVLVRLGLARGGSRPVAQVRSPDGRTMDQPLELGRFRIEPPASGS
jgi:uncharacterized membrane protein